MNAILPPVETAHAAVMQAYAEKRLQIHLDLPLLVRPGSPAHDALDVFVPLLILMPSSLTLLLAFNILVWIVGLSFVLLFQIFLSPSYVAWRTKRRVLKALTHLHNFQLLWSYGGIALTVAGQADHFCLAPMGHWREFTYRFLMTEPAADAGEAT